MAKYIFVTGGVTSSLGKGILGASLGKLLQARGFRVTIQKFDPYINVDPGTLNPYEHGECFVTDDGAETDLDLGHYERFLGITTSKANNVTTGKVYQSVINKERQGAYLGKTVQVIPHITDEIQRRMMLLGETGDYDIVITEIGGTVGDIESQPFLEAIRQLRWKLDKKDAIIVHLTLIPFLDSTGELKSKPTQHSVKEMSQNGLQPDVLVCRTHHDIPEEIRTKLALFCNVREEAVIEAIDLPSIYRVPNEMQREGLDVICLKHLQLSSDTPVNLDRWNTFLDRVENPKDEITIGIVGKYVELADAYKSINEALIHGGTENNTKVNLKYIHSEFINSDNMHSELKGLDGVLVAPGFGHRGIQGKIEAIQFIRENNIPFLGICLGMQCSVIEYSRNVLKLADANSTEMETTTNHPVIGLMESQKSVSNKGGTMRLGAYPCQLKEGTLARSIYGQEHISERHRHRFEFNNAYLEQLEEAGMIASGINPETNLVEIVEVPEHPFFVGVQFHPEYKSTVDKPHPLFTAFVGAALQQKKQK